VKPATPAQRLTQIVHERYGRELHRYLMNCLRHPQNARDLEQEVYLRLLRVPQADLVRNVQGYMHRIAAHVVHEYRLRAQKEIVTFDSQAVHECTARGGETAEEEEAPEERLSKLRQLEGYLLKLPPMWRKTFILHKCHGIARTDVARQLGISENTVKIYVNRAIAALRAAKWE